MTGDPEMSPLNDATPRLVRPYEDRTLLGVCSGLARYLGVDVFRLRVVFLVTTILGGGGLVAYLILWFVVPAEE